MPEPLFDVSVILPVFNEESNLAPLYEEILAALGPTGKTFEVIFVDDRSFDRSADVLENLIAQEKGASVSLIRLRRNVGQSAALAAGIDAAQGDIAVLLDADGQNNPADIPTLLEHIERGFDVVSGWRRDRKDAMARSLISRIANRLISLISGLKLHDYGCTLKAYRMDLLRKIQIYGDMHRFLPVFLAQLGARVVEIEVDHRARQSGQSKYGSERILRVLADIINIQFLTGYSSRPMHFFGRLGTFSVAIAFLCLMIMMAIKFGWLKLIGIEYTASFIQTPLPVLSAMFFLGGLMAYFFGILAEMLVKIQYQSAGYQPFQVDHVSRSSAHRSR